MIPKQRSHVKSRQGNQNIFINQQNHESMGNTVLAKTDFLDEFRMFLYFHEISFHKFKNLKDYRKHGLRYICFILYRKNQNYLIICVSIWYLKVQKIHHRPIIKCTRLLQHCRKVPSMLYDAFDCIYKLINIWNNYLLKVLCYLFNDEKYTQSLPSRCFTLQY